MKSTLAFALACALSSTAGTAAAQDPSRGGLKSAGCAAMTGLRLPDVRITEAVAVAADAPSGGKVKTPHCKVSGVIGRRVRFESLLPDAWNQPLLMGGGGGFLGAVGNQAGSSVDAGYAT